MLYCYSTSTVCNAHPLKIRTVGSHDVMLDLMTCYSILIPLVVMSDVCRHVCILYVYIVCAVTEVLYVSAAGERVCVEVEIEDNAAVEEERNITLSLNSTSHGLHVGPSATITILDNDGLLPL